MSKLTTWKKWIGLLVTSFALAIIIIDTTVLNVSLKEIMKDLHADLQTMQWIITIYSLVLAALTITGGRLGDLFGRKRMFVTGAALFGLGSLIASFSTSSVMLLFGWSIIEGIGAALMMPATASMLVTNFQGKERAIAFGVWGSIAGASSAFGPLLGGYLTDNASWHWAFRINVVIVLLVMLGSVVLKETVDKKEAHTLDVVGSILSGISMASIIYGIVESSTYGWLKAKAPWEIFGHEYALAGISITVWSLLLGIIFLVAFILWEQKVQKAGKTPLVSLSLFKNKQFVIGILITAILALGQAGIIFSIPVFLTTVKGLSAFNVGKALLPMSVSVLIIAPLTAVLRQKIPIRILLQIGVIANAIGVYLLYTALTLTSETKDLAPGLFFMGLGMGLTSSIISNVTLSAIDVNMAGEASGVNNTIRQLGSSLGSALIGAVFLSTLVSGMTERISTSKYIPDIAKPAIVAGIESNSGQQQNLTIPVELARAVAPEGLKRIGQEILTAKNEASAEASRASLLMTLVFSGVTFLATFLLPAKLKDSEKGVAVAGH